MQRDKKEEAANMILLEQAYKEAKREAEAEDVELGRITVNIKDRYDQIISRIAAVGANSRIAM